MLMSTNNHNMASEEVHGKKGSMGKRAADTVEDDAKRSKPSISVGTTKTLQPINLSKRTGIKLKINAPVANNKPLIKNTSVFNDESEEEEEIPREAKMRMRNIGRNTPTSSGPNSFGKTKQGFCNVKKVFENNLKKTEEELSGEDSLSKRN